ncbi:GtrA family protein [Paenibacillus elgii]|uniref:GtrA family protein n=1 Tax=Paenibacillus elgii TaxID=189691 RepID=UPI000FDA71D9|nr:GtrA family protein [Paenibacillus elgii]NEN86220.1 GtrA family protein [Paenibacillus elgii]
MSRKWVSIVRFCVTGAINTGIDLTVFTVLTLSSVPYLAAQGAAFVCGLLNSYFMNRTWTFGQKGKSRPAEWMKFCALNLLIFSMSTALLIWLHEYRQLPMPVSKLGAMGAGMIVNYLGSRFWVFAASGPANLIQRSESA